MITHCFHGREGGILGDKGRVRPAVLAAVDRGRAPGRRPRGRQLLVRRGRAGPQARAAARDDLERPASVQYQRARVRPGDDAVEVPPPGPDARTGHRAGHVPPGEDIRLRRGAGHAPRGGRGRRRGALAPRGGLPLRSTRWATAGSGIGSCSRWRRSSRAGSTGRRRSPCPGRSDRPRPRPPRGPGRRGRRAATARRRARRPPSPRPGPA